MNFRYKIIGDAIRIVFCLFLMMGTALIQAEMIKAQSVADSAAQESISVRDLTVEMGVQPQNLKIDAAATYNLKSEKDSLQRLSLRAADMNVSSVSVDGKEAEFTMEKGKLSVVLPTLPKKNQELELRIRYSSAPHFGVIKDRHNTVWTSFLPKAQRHWVPMINGSQVQLKSSFKISVPSDYQVWATGNKTGQRAVNQNVTQYHFASEDTVPAAEIGFAIGHFKTDSTKQAGAKINLMVPQALTDSVAGQPLLQKATDWLSRVEKQTQSEYPYNSLDIVVLDDHYWETKSWGASTIYLYRNRGDLKTQLLRGLIGQWASAQALPYRWEQADAVTLYQTLIQHNIANQDFSLKITDQPEPAFSTIYDQFGPARWNAWQQKWKSWKENPQGLFANIPPAMLQQFVLKMSGPEYAEYWQEQPVFQLANLEGEKDSSATTQSPADSVVYAIDYSYNQADGSLRLDFKALQGQYAEPQLITFHKAYESRIEDVEVDFSGANDSATLSVESGLRSAWITIPNNLNMGVDEQKPVSFLMYELEHAERTTQRARAARNLGDHTQNPDIQLAVNDALSGNIEPEVRAGLLSSLADITAGAAGTQQDFLEALQDNNRVIQKAALRGLQNYPDNADVQNSVKRFTMAAKDDALFGKGVITFAKLSSDQELQSLLSDIARQDSTGRRSIAAIKYLAKEGIGQKKRTESLSRFLDAGNPYELRSKVLSVLIEYDQSSENWLKRGKGALRESADPRIRYLVARGMLKNSSPEVKKFLQEYVADEHDLRVRQLIKKGL